MSHKKVQRTDPLTQSLPPVGVDSHAHLAGSEFDADREEVLARAAACGVARIGNIFLEPAAFAEQKRLFDAHPEVFFVLGIHPCEGQTCDKAALEHMRQAFADEPRLRAVGEIGLDFYWDDCPKELQYQAFLQQLDLARELAKPVVIHCRNAEEETLALLEGRGFADYPLLWHCFGGAPALARRIVRNGWHISIPGPVSYPANAALREAVAVIPDDCLLLETDSPYLPPVPFRGKRNDSAKLPYIAARVAEVKGLETSELARITSENARRLFGF